MILLACMIAGLLLILPVTAAGGTPAIEWQKCLGGAASDDVRAVRQTMDGGYIVAGGTNSTDGDVMGYHGDWDFWVVKLDAAGGLVWQKCLGGSDYDFAYTVQQTADGGYIVAGESRSSDGDVTKNQGWADFWVVKLDAAGGLVWQKALGGAGWDRATAVQQTADGGYVVAGYTYSNSGDVTGNRGSGDFWMVKLDAAGNLVRQKCLGGTSYDEAFAMHLTTDGGYIMVGRTFSNNGDVKGNHGDWDCWVVKVDATGNLVWQKCLGGTGYDEANAVQQTADGGYIVVGETWSKGGDVSGLRGEQDIWVVKLDAAGNLVWQKCLGGSYWDWAYAVQQTTNGGYIVAGFTNSNDGDISGNHGYWDFWMVKLDAAGGLVWQKCLGGTAADEAHAVQQTADGGYIVAGRSLSSDGDVAGRHGELDYWLVKLSADVASFTAAPLTAPYGSAVRFTLTPAPGKTIRAAWWSFDYPAHMNTWNSRKINPTFFYPRAGIFSPYVKITYTDGTTEVVHRVNYVVVTTTGTVTPTPTQPGPFKPLTIPGRIEAEDYDLGGEGVAYHDTTTGNTGGEYRKDDVDIEQIAGEGTPSVGWIRTGEWLQYSANVLTTGQYTLMARVASPNSGRIATLTVDGATAAAIPVPNTGGFTTFTTITVPITLTAGTHTLRLTFSGDGQNLNWLEFAPAGPTTPPTTPVPSGGASFVAEPTTAPHGSAVKFSITPAAGKSISGAWWSFDAPAHLNTWNSRAVNPTFFYPAAGTFSPLVRLTYTDGTIEEVHRIDHVWAT
jgi:hypothetical protein